MYKQSSLPIQIDMCVLFQVRMVAPCLLQENNSIQCMCPNPSLCSETSQQTLLYWPVLVRYIRFYRANTGSLYQSSNILHVDSVVVQYGAAWNGPVQKCSGPIQNKKATMIWFLYVISVLGQYSKLILDQYRTI